MVMFHSYIGSLPAGINGVKWWISQCLPILIMDNHGLFIIG